MRIVLRTFLGTIIFDKKKEQFSDMLRSQPTPLFLRRILKKIREKNIPHKRACPTVPSRKKRA